MPRVKANADVERLTSPAVEVPPSPHEIAAGSQPAKTRLLKPDYQKLSLWQALEKMDEDDWSDKVLYLQRTSPFTINKSTREKYGSLDKGVFMHWTEDDFRKRFGGGRFHLRLNCGRETWCEAKPEWGDPIRLLADEELKSLIASTPINQPPSDGENTAKVVKMFLEDQRARREEEGDQSGVEVLDNAITLMSKASEKAIEIAASGKGNGGSLSEIAATLKTLHEMSAPKDQLTSKDLLTFMSGIVKRGDNPAAEPRSAISEIKEVMAVLKELREESGGTAPVAEGKQDWRLYMVQAVMEGIKNLPAILRENREAQMQQFQMLIASRALQGGVPLPAGNPAAVNFQPTPGAPPSPAAPQAGDPFFGEIKANIVRMFKEGDGGDFVARMIQVMNPNLYTALAAAPEAEIVKFVQADAVLKEIAASEDFPQFVKEMMEFFQQEKEPQLEPEPALVQ